ncbi:MAG: hypothetical protein LBT24_06375, partial [Tannerella sp.]|nr:hypothetical protein [Tannerella sp.]
KTSYSKINTAPPIGQSRAVSGTVRRDCTGVIPEPNADFGKIGATLGIVVAYAQHNVGAHFVGA